MRGREGGGAGWERSDLHSPESIDRSTPSCNDAKPRQGRAAGSNFELQSYRPKQGLAGEEMRLQLTSFRFGFRFSQLSLSDVLQGLTPEVLETGHDW